jgi:ribosomal protein L11 methylase PrmA
MSENNFAITEPVKEKKSEEAKEKPLTSFRFTRQRSGAKAVKRRKRKERRRINTVKFANKEQKWIKKITKTRHINQIRRGFDIAKRWRDDKER